MKHFRAKPSAHCTSYWKPSRQQQLVLLQHSVVLDLASQDMSRVTTRMQYIRPHLEYAAAVWDPHQQGLINSLERVQKLALKASTRNWKASYDTLINTCNVPTLEEHGHCLKLSILYQIFNGHISIPSAPVERRTLQRNLRNSSSLMLQRRPAVHTNAHQFSFFPHTITLWNQLPLSVQSCTSLTTFKHSLLSLNV